MTLGKSTGMSPLGLVAYHCSYLVVSVPYPQGCQVQRRALFGPPLPGCLWLGPVRNTLCGAERRVLRGTKSKHAFWRSALGHHQNKACGMLCAFGFSEATAAPNSAGS